MLCVKAGHMMPKHWDKCQPLLKTFELKNNLHDCDWLKFNESKRPWHVTQPLPALHKYGMVVYFPGLD